MKTFPLNDLPPELRLRIIDEAIRPAPKIKITFHLKNNYDPLGDQSRCQVQLSIDDGFRSCLALLQTNKSIRAYARPKLYGRNIFVLWGANSSEQELVALLMWFRGLGSAAYLVRKVEMSRVLCSRYRIGNEGPSIAGMALILADYRHVCSSLHLEHLTVPFDLCLRSEHKLWRKTRKGFMLLDLLSMPDAVEADQMTTAYLQPESADDFSDPSALTEQQLIRRAKAIAETIIELSASLRDQHQSGLYFNGPVDLSAPARAAVDPDGPFVKFAARLLTEAIEREVRHQPMRSDR